MVSVLLTRPQQASETLALELKRHGYSCVVEPLLTVVPTELSAPDISDAQAVMITSSSALTVLKDTIIDKALLGMPCFCVGSRTALKARAFGFRHVRSSNGDGDELATLIMHSLGSAGKPILHIAGRDMDSKAQDKLRAAGFHITIWVVYAAIAATAFSTHTAVQLQQNGLDAVLVFSVRTAQTLRDLVIKHNLQKNCAKICAIGLSTAITDVLQPLPWRKLAAAEHPTEDSVLARLNQILPA